MSRLATIVLAGIVQGACTSEADPATPTPTEATSPTASPSGTDPIQDVGVPDPR